MASSRSRDREKELAVVGLGLHIARLAALRNNCGGAITLFSEGGTWNTTEAKETSGGPSLSDLTVVSRKGEADFRKNGGRIETVRLTVAQWLLLTLLTAVLGHAQDIQFLPEVDTYLTVDQRIRLLIQAKDDREGGDPQQFTFGPSVQFYLKPLLKLKKTSLFDLDDVKRRMVVFETGYRIITAPHTLATNRAIEAVTFHLPLMFGILLADRNRGDLDWQGGTFTWRYRNRLTAQRTVSVYSYHLIPYVAAEPFYESKYGKWSTTDLYAGCRFPMGKVVQLDLYYEHENNTGKSPNQQNTYFGANLNLYFFSERARPSQ